MKNIFFIRAIHLFLVLSIIFNFTFPLTLFALSQPEVIANYDETKFKIWISDVIYKSNDTYELNLSYNNTSKEDINFGKNQINIEQKKFKIGENINAFKYTIKCGEKNSIIAKNLQNKEVILVKPFEIPCSKTNGNIEPLYLYKKTGEKMSPSEINEARAGYKEATVISDSTCENPKGWIEDKEAKNANSNIYYFLEDPKSYKHGDTPQNNSYKFLKISCTSLVKQNFKSESGKFLKIDNTIVKLNKPNLTYTYTNNGNDFKVYFPTNPNLGWKYVNGTNTFTVSKVSIGDKNLAVADVILQDNTITYKDIVKNVDLQYTVNNEGVTKYVIINSVEAFDSDLTKITFNIENNEALKKTSKLDEGINSKSFRFQVSSIFSKSKININDIYVKKNELSSIISRVTPEEKVILENKKIELDKLLEKVIKNDKLTLKNLDNEYNRIINIPTDDTKIEIKANNLFLSTPETLIVRKNVDQVIVKKDSFDLKDNQLNIYIDVESLKNDKDIIYPIKVDPNITQTTSKDTFTTQYYPTSARGTNNSKMLSVGTKSLIYTSSGNVGVGNTYTFLRFEMPNDLRNSTQAYESTLKVYAYDVHNGGLRANILDYCGKDFNEATMTWNTQGDICSAVGTMGKIDLYPGTGFRYGQINERVTKHIGESVGINAIINNYGIYKGYVSLVFVDDYPAYPGDITLCAKDTNLAPCNYGTYAPKLEIVYRPPTKPSIPNNLTPSLDNIGNCNLTNNSGDCSIGKNIFVTAENVNDGSGSCNPNRVRLTEIEKSSWTDWTFYYNNSNGLNYTEGWNLGGVGKACNVKNDFVIYRQNGTYVNYFESNNDLGTYSGWSNPSIYTIDNSPPVRIGKVNTLPTYVNTGSVQITTPTFVDDSQNVVVIENAATGNRIDSTGAIFKGYPRNYYTQTLAANNTVTQDWVMEGSGLIRNFKNGACLGEDGTGNNIFSSVDCKDIVQYKWIYNPETGEIRSKNQSQCLTQVGNTLQQLVCNSTTSQKWNIKQSVTSQYNGTVPTYGFNTNKVVQYEIQYSTDAGFTQNVSFSGLSSSNTFNLGNLTDGVWYFRAYAKDRANGGNISNFIYLGQVLVDNTKPIINNVKVESNNPKLANDTRFSPNNSSSIGKSDLLKIDFNLIEKYPESATITIVNPIDNTEIKTINIDIKNRVCTTGCLVSTTWDGKNTAGSFVADGKVLIKIKANDMTSVTYQDINKRYANEYILPNVLTATIDNLGANIAISSHANNIWVNSQNITIFGGLAGYNKNTTSEDRDIDKAYYCIGLNCTPTTNLTFDNIKNFSLPVSLVVGENNFKFTTEDLAYNIISVIGNPNITPVTAENAVASWKINYDNTLPSLTELNFTKVNNTLEYTWKISDTLSGIKAIWKDDIKYELKYSNGVIATNPVSGICTLTGAYYSCKMIVSNITEGAYSLKLIANDRAGNITSKTIDNYVKLSTYLEHINPKDASIVADNYTIYKGKSEKGNTITIENNGAKISFVNDITSNNTLPTKVVSTPILVNDIESKLNIVCGTTLDHDNNPSTNNLSLCEYSIKLLNLTSGVKGVLLKNNVKIVTTDTLGNIVSKLLYINVDPTTLNLTIDPSSIYFSPNGDGKYDGIDFKNILTSSNSAAVITNIINYQAIIKNSSGIEVWKQTGTNILPEIINFNGKNSTTNQFVVDGNYKYSITIQKDNLSLPIVSQNINIIAKNKVTASEKVILISPKINAIQTRGSFIIAGQAPANWNVDICISKIATDPRTCINDITNDTYKLSTRTTSTGYFESIVTISDTSTKDYFITITSNNGAGTYTPQTDPKK